MKHFKIKWIVLFMVVLTGTSAAGYRRLDDRMKAYEPPYTPLPHRSAPLDRTRPDRIDTMTNHLLKMSDEWLNLGLNPGAFLRMDESRRKALEEIANDDSKLLRFLNQPVAIHDLEILTLFRSQAIKAAAGRFRAVLRRFSQAAYLDEILYRYSAFTRSLMTGIGPMKGMNSTAVNFPFPGVMALKGDIVAHSAAAALETLTIERRNAVAKMRKAYWNLLYIQGAEAITRETASLFAGLERVADTRYKSGKTSFQDVVKIEIRRRTLEEELTTLKESRRNVEAEMSSLLNLDPNPTVIRLIQSRPSASPPDLAPLYGKAIETRQELRKKRAMIKKMEKMLEMAETMILPTFTLNLSLYEDNPVMKVGTSAMQPAFAVSTRADKAAGSPKSPWFGKDDAYISEARMTLSALRSELKQAESDTRTSVRKAWSDLDRASRETSLYKNHIVSETRSVLDVSTRGYESGKASFAEVVDSHTDWLHAGLALQRKKSDMGIAWAELSRIIGMDMVSNHVQ